MTLAKRWGNIESTRLAENSVAGVNPDGRTRSVCGRGRRAGIQRRGKAPGLHTCCREPANKVPGTAARRPAAAKNHPQDVNIRCLSYCASKRISILANLFSLIDCFVRDRINSCGLIFPSITLMYSLRSCHGSSMIGATIDKYCSSMAWANLSRAFLRGNFHSGCGVHSQLSHHLFMPWWQLQEVRCLIFTVFWGGWFLSHWDRNVLLIDCFCDVFNNR